MKTKVCSRCDEEKSVEDFYANDDYKDGYSCWCKKCKKKNATKNYFDSKEHYKKVKKKWRERNKEQIEEYNLKYYKENKRRIKKQNKKYYERHREEMREKQKQYYEEHREEIIESNKEYYYQHREKMLKLNKKYYEENKDKIREQNRKYWHNHKEERIQKKVEYHRKRLANNPQFRLEKNISAQMRHALKEGKNGRHWEDLVDYTLDELKQRLECQFEEGMSWDNYGEWEIDHKKPKSLFNYESFDSKEFKDCWKLSNLQPLWGKENNSKNNSFNI